MKHTACRECGGLRASTDARCPVREPGALRSPWRPHAAGVARPKGLLLRGERPRGRSRVADDGCRPCLLESLRADSCKTLREERLLYHASMLASAFPFFCRGCCYHKTLVPALARIAGRHGLCHSQGPWAVQGVQRPRGGHYYVRCRCGVSGDSARSRRR